MPNAVSSKVDETKALMGKLRSEAVLPNVGVVDGSVDMPAADTQRSNMVAVDVFL